MGCVVNHESMSRKLRSSTGGEVMFVVFDEFRKEIVSSCAKYVTRNDQVSNTGVLSSESEMKNKKIYNIKNCVGGVFSICYPSKTTSYVSF